MKTVPYLVIAFTGWQEDLGLKTTEKIPFRRSCDYITEFY